MKRLGFTRGAHRAPQPARRIPLIIAACAAIAVIATMIMPSGTTWARWYDEDVKAPQQGVAIDPLNLSSYAVVDNYTTYAQSGGTKPYNFPKIVIDNPNSFSLKFKLTKLGLQGPGYLMDDISISLRLSRDGNCDSDNYEFMYDPSDGQTFGNISGLGLGDQTQVAVGFKVGVEGAEPPMAQKGTTEGQIGPGHKLTMCPRINVDALTPQLFSQVGGGNIVVIVYYELSDPAGQSYGIGPAPTDGSCSLVNGEAGERCTQTVFTVNPPDLKMTGCGQPFARPNYTQLRMYWGEDPSSSQNVAVNHYRIYARTAPAVKNGDSYDVAGSFTPWERVQGRTGIYTHILDAENGEVPATATDFSIYNQWIPSDQPYIGQFKVQACFDNTCQDGQITGDTAWVYFDNTPSIAKVRDCVPESQWQHGGILQTPRERVAPLLPEEMKWDQWPLP